MMKRIWMNDGRVWAVAVLAGLLAVTAPAQWIVDGSPWPDGGGGFSPDSDPDDPCADCVQTNHTGDVSIDGELLLTGGLTLGGVRRETWPEGGGAELYPSNWLHVDNGRSGDAGTPDGSVARPFVTVQAALDAIGAADSPEAYTNAAGRFVAVNVAPGIYVEDVTIPLRPNLLLAMDSAVIEGDVTWDVSGWGDWPVASPIPRVTIRGDSLRAAYMGGMHSVVGIAGSLTVQGAPQKAAQPIRFYELHVIHAGISEGVRYAGGTVHDWGHLFLERAMVGPIVNTNGWGGAALYAQGWGYGGVGSDAESPQGGIGPLVGRVHPLNMQTILVAGMDITGGSANWYATWHNVMFQRHGDVRMTDVPYGVRLDTASYASWLAATSEGDRGDWHTDAAMRLTDGPITATVDSPTLHVPKFIGDELFIHGSGGLTIYRATGLTSNDWVVLWMDE